MKIYYLVAIGMAGMLVFGGIVIGQTFAQENSFCETRHILTTPLVNGSLDYVNTGTHYEIECSPDVSVLERNYLKASMETLYPDGDIRIIGPKADPTVAELIDQIERLLARIAELNASA